MGLDIFFKTRQRDRLIDKMSAKELKDALIDTLYVLGQADKWNLDSFYRQMTDKLGQAENEEGYLRKANYVYAYFKGRIDEGCECEVTRDDLIDLIKRCCEVLGKRDNATSKATLPTCNGFFFGSTDYDDVYYETVKFGLELFTKLLNNYDDTKVLYVWFCY